MLQFTGSRQKYFQSLIRYCFALSLCLNAFAVAQAEQIAEQLPGYAIASAHPLATNAGLEVLAKGGNAFDAAVAVSAALAVVAPYHSGLGGGGFWLLHDAKSKKNIFIDGRETAPHAAKKDMFLDKEGKPIADLSLNGGLAAAIPGEPAAIVYIAQHFGRLPLKDSLAPAIRLAEQGFPVDYQFRHFTTMGDRLQQMQKYPATARMFLHDGKPYAIGDQLKQADLAETLRRIAKEGRDGFYKGDVAAKMVQSIRAAGGIWTLEDLDKYQIKIREPLLGAYHNMLIITAPPPSAGGISLLMTLNILSAYSLDNIPKVSKVHYILEAMRLAYWQRSLGIGDPDFVNNRIQTLISAEKAKELRQHIADDKATPSQNLSKAGAESPHSSTTHVSIIDANGNRVAATMSVNYIFGSNVLAEGTGVLLNDTMDDFAAKAGYPNVFGLIGSEANAIAPGKRPTSSMAPTFLEMPGRLAILGTPGGSRIPSMVLLASLVFHDYHGAISMVSKMRYHHQFLPDIVQFEPETFSLQTQLGLKSMGYHLMELTQNYGDMQVVTWEKALNFLSAASDPRHIGLAAVIKVNNDDGYGVNH